VKIKSIKETESERFEDVIDKLISVPPNFSFTRVPSLSEQFASAYTPSDQTVQALPFRYGSERDLALPPSHPQTRGKGLV